MSWETVPVFTKTTGRPMVSAYLRASAAGKVRMTLNLSAFVIDDLAQPEFVKIEFGKGENAGSLRITNDPGGGHRVTNGMRGSKRILMPAFDGLPLSAAKTEPCPILSKEKGELIIRLPIAEWEIANSRAKLAGLPPSGFAAPRPVQAALPAPAKTPPAPPGTKLDMVKYLTGKGVVIKRISQGQYKLEGDLVGPIEVLELVNSHRKRGDLPTLDLNGVE